MKRNLQLRDQRITNIQGRRSHRKVISKAKARCKRMKIAWNGKRQVERFPAPFAFNILGDKNRETVLRFISRLREAVLARESRVVVDFSDTEILHPIAALLFVAELDRMQRIVPTTFSVSIENVRIPRVAQVPAFVASVLVLTGWYVLFRQSIAIKEREELTDQVRMISAQIDSILSKCGVYYSSENQDHIGHLSARIKGELHLISRYIAILKLIGLDLEVTEDYIKFKMLATGLHFETTDFLNQLKIPNWEQELAYSAFELRYKIESSFFRWSNRKVQRAALA